MEGEDDVGPAAGARARLARLLGEDHLRPVPRCAACADRETEAA